MRTFEVLTEGTDESFPCGLSTRSFNLGPDSTAIMDCRRGNSIFLSGTYRLSLKLRVLLLRTSRKFKSSPADFSLTIFAALLNFDSNIFLFAGYLFWRLKRLDVHCFIKFYFSYPRCCYLTTTIFRGVTLVFCISLWFECGFSPRGVTAGDAFGLSSFTR